MTDEDQRADFLSRPKPSLVLLLQFNIEKNSPFYLRPLLAKPHEVADKIFRVAKNAGLTGPGEFDNTGVIAPGDYTRPLDIFRQKFLGPNESMIL